MLRPVVIAALLALPLALAHDPAGTPKNYCEPLSEWNTHDYGPPGTGGIAYRSPTVDGNLGGDCNPGFNPGSPCVSVDPANPFATVVDVCGFNPPVADADGHREWALGWGRLLAQETTSSGYGATGCWNEPAHHSMFSPISVTDVVLGSGASFYVMTDFSPAPFNGPGDCGDGQVNPGLVEGEQFFECVGSCVPTFPPGADGSYIVVVQGTLGHITAN